MSKTVMSKFANSMRKEKKARKEKAMQNVNRNAVAA
jgi:hypothetical protein